VDSIYLRNNFSVFIKYTLLEATEYGRILATPSLLFPLISVFYENFTFCQETSSGNILTKYFAPFLRFLLTGDHLMRHVMVNGKSYCFVPVLLTYS